MIYVFRRANSTSARALATAVEGLRWRLARPQTGRLPVAGDIVICWGEAQPSGLAPGVLTLNGGPLRNKLTDATALRAAGVATIEAVQQRPPAAPAVSQVDPALIPWSSAQDLAADFVEIEGLARTPVMERGLSELIRTFTELQRALSTPIPTAVPASSDVWIPRMFNHVGGDDLLQAPTAPDYFSKKLNLVEEYRIHSFDGRSIRAGRKVLRDGFVTGNPGAAPAPGTQIGPNQAASPWIRSFDGGWRINYDGFESSRAMRELAAAACTALNLVFGAVDIGLTRAGQLVVLEVNRAPGLEGGSIQAYASATTRWVTEHGTAAARRAAA